MSNQIAETLLHTFTLEPPLFEDAEKISTRIQGNDKEETLYYKMSMPPCGVGLGPMTRHIHEFSRRADALEIPDEHGKARFSLFRNSLTNASPIASWEEVTKDLTDTDPRTPERFIATGKAWIARVSVPSDREDQILWMRTVQKGPGMTTEMFDSNLRLTNNLTDWLPGTQLILTEDELKATFFNGMPHAWKAQHQAAGKSSQTETHVAILAYMRCQERESDLKSRRNMQKQTSNASSNRSGRSNYNGGRNQSSGGRGRGRGDRTHRRPSNNRDQG